MKTSRLKADPDSIVVHERTDLVEPSKPLQLSADEVTRLRALMAEPEPDERDWKPVCSLNASPSAQAWLDARADGAKAILRREGLPDSLRLSETSPGCFTGCLAMVADRPGTLEWYAAETLRRVGQIQAALDSGDALGALQAQQELGGLLLLGELEHGFGRDLIAGRRERRRKSEGGSKRPPETEQVRSVVATIDAELRAAIPGLTKKSDRARRILKRIEKERARGGLLGLKHVPGVDRIRRYLE